MAWVALIAAFGGALMGALIVGVIGAAAGASFSDPTPAVSISATIVQDLSFIGAALLFAGIAGRPLPEQFGLRPTRFWPAVGWMAAAFAAFYAFTLVWVAILGVSPDDSKLPDELGVKDSTVRAARGGLPGRGRGADRGGVLLPRLLLRRAAQLEGPVARGDHHRRWCSASIHVGSAEAAFLLPLAFFGFALCLLRERTGSLYPGVALHCMNNSLAFGVSQHWNWQILVLLVCALGIISLVALVVRASWTPVPAPAG